MTIQSQVQPLKKIPLPIAVSPKKYKRVFSVQKSDVATLAQQISLV